MCFFDCKCKSLKRLGENRKTTERNINKKQNNSKENSKNRNTGFPAHEPLRKINISKGLAGRFSFFVLLCFPSSSFFLFYFLFYKLCFYMCFFDCKCKSLKRLGENIKQTERNIIKTEKNRKQLEGKHKTQKYRISSPRTSANNLCDLSAEVRGLEILYFCFFYLFMFSLEFFFFCFSLFLLCFFLLFYVFLIVSFF